MSSSSEQGTKVENGSVIGGESSQVVSEIDLGLNCRSSTSDIDTGNPPERNSPVEDDSGVIAAPAAATTSNVAMEAFAPVPPAEIPPERDEEDEDESEYSYEEDEDAAFSGFLLSSAPLPASSPIASGSQSVTEANIDDTKSAPARIRDEDEPVTASVTEPRKSKWREPSREAVSMSLRAEREKTGGKRRLAQDLYRIMNQDTDEAGFSIAPKSEDTMDNWVIKLFKFDSDSNLAKDMLVLGLEHIELEMTFPEQYPFEPPFVRVVSPRFKRQTGFVMNGALCMELLTNDGWNPVNDIESVIVSIRSLLVVGDGRLQAAYEMPSNVYEMRLNLGQQEEGKDETNSRKRCRQDGDVKEISEPLKKVSKEDAGAYSLSEANAAYSHLLHYHKKKGWDSSGWWARKG